MDRLKRGEICAKTIQFSPSNVKNADELIVLYRLQSNKKVVWFRNEECYAGSKSKMTLTELFAINADNYNLIKYIVKLNIYSI